MSGAMRILVPPTQKMGFKKDIPLGAMVDGKGIHIDVRALVAAVDDSPHVLCHERLIADDDPLGKRLGAAGVSHLAGVFDVQDHIGFSYLGPHPSSCRTARKRSSAGGCPLP